MINYCKSILLISFTHPVAHFVADAVADSVTSGFPCTIVMWFNAYWIIRTLKINSGYKDTNARNNIRDTFEIAVHGSFAVTENQHESSDDEDEI